MFYNSILASNSGDPYYADLLITEIFENNSASHNGESREVKSAIIHNVILTQIMYVYILGEMKDAVNHCHNVVKDKDSMNPARLNSLSTKEWDQVAAYIIGSLEGYRTGGSPHFSDGMFLWSLGNKRSVEFDRRNEDDYAKVNYALLNYLLSGKGQIQHMNCHFMDRTSTLIANMLLIPMVQSVVKYAISNQYRDWKSADVEIYEGEYYARFLYPIYLEFNKDSAETLQKNMMRNMGSLVQDGPQTVADAYLAVAEKTGIQCEYIGKSFEVDSCLHYTPNLKVSFFCLFKCVILIIFFPL